MNHPHFFSLSVLHFQEEKCFDSAWDASVMAKVRDAEKCTCKAKWYFDVRKYICTQNQEECKKHTGGIEKERKCKIGNRERALLGFIYKSNVTLQLKLMN